MDASAMEEYSKSVAEAANIVDGGKAEEKIDDYNLDFVQLDSQINYKPIMIAQTGSKDMTNS